jgi:hypothetical protein
MLEWFGIIQQLLLGISRASVAGFSNDPEACKKVGSCMKCFSVAVN